MNRLLGIFVVLGAVNFCFPARAAVDFEKEVAPVLTAACAACHGDRAALGGLRIHTREMLTAKTSMGPLVTPGDPAKSALYVSLSLPRGNPKAMPPTAPLPDAQKELIRAWIAEGAVWPGGIALGIRKPSSSFQDDLVLVEAARTRIAGKSAPVAAGAMKPYAEPIPATDVSIDFVPIPGGTFTMGTPEGEPGRNPSEGPAHRVQVEPFWMGKFEITWDAYRLFMFAQQANEGQDPDAMVDAISRPTPPYVEMSFGMGLNGFPAISMTQHAANKFAQWLSTKTGHFYRLPTEAEWEYACRAGTSTAYSFGNDPGQLGEYAWFAGNSEGKYQKVGTKKPNAWGLHDMHGNVVEWTLDQYDESFYASGGKLAVNPWNKASAPYPHVARGGGWAEDAPSLRCGARLASDPEWKIQDPQLPKSIWYHTDAQWLGFRLVRPLRLPEAKEIFDYWNSGVEHD